MIKILFLLIAVVCCANPDIYNDTVLTRTTYQKIEVEKHKAFLGEQCEASIYTREIRAYKFTCPICAEIIEYEEFGVADSSDVCGCYFYYPSKKGCYKLEGIFDPGDNTAVYISRALFFVCKNCKKQTQKALNEIRKEFQESLIVDVKAHLKLKMALKMTNDDIYPGNPRGSNFIVVSPRKEHLTGIVVPQKKSPEETVIKYYVDPGATYRIIIHGME